jgi:hypothetical protein
MTIRWIRLVALQSDIVERNPGDENGHDEATEVASGAALVPLQLDNNNTVENTDMHFENLELVMEEQFSSQSLFGTLNCGLVNTPWEYLGEGGKHALFFFNHNIEGTIADNSNCDAWMGKLLRVDKIHLRVAEAMCRMNDTTTASIVEAVSEPSFADLSQKIPSCTGGDMTIFYIQHVVAPFLHPFVDIPEVIPLTWSFLKGLQTKALNSGRIPLSRQSDWVANNTDMMDMIAGKLPCGMIVVDYRSILQSIPCSSRNYTSYIFELKPKAGYLAFSPLVLPNHRIKYEQSRFKCLQQLQHQGHWTKGWTRGSKPDNIEISLYEPLDLFSGNRSLTARAVRELLRVSQNNLRVWCNHGSEEILFGGQPRDWKQSGSGDKDILQEILVEILCSGVAQDLLQRILLWQKLDVLDVDGAVLIYERLVDFCQSEKEAQDLLDQIQLEDIIRSDESKDTIPAIPMLESSPFRCDRMPVTEQEVLRKFCQTTLEFRNRLRDWISEHRIEPTSDAAFMEQARNKLLDMIQCELSIMACIFLLRNWLLSLMMCDVSIFVTVEEQFLTMDKGELLTEESVEHVITLAQDNVTKLFQYNLHVIDLDPKPAKKLHGRSKAEAAFRLLLRE